MDYGAEIRNFDVPDDQPITKALLEAVVDVSEQYGGDSEAVAGKTLALLVNAITALERRIADIEAR